MEASILPSVPACAGIALVVLFLYHFIIYPSFLSPLAKIPNAHPLAPYTSLWILWARYRIRENNTVLQAHQQHGEVVRLAPNEVSINCVNDGIKTVYGKGFEKPPFYTVFVNYGALNMFSSLHSPEHAMRKKRISNIYSKSFLQASPDATAIIQEVVQRRLLPQFANHANAKKPMDIYPIYKATAMDLTTSYFFGLSAGTQFVTDLTAAARWQNLYLDDQHPVSLFWLQELPGLTAWLEKLGISPVPRSRHLAHDHIAAWCLNMSDGAEIMLAKKAGGSSLEPGHLPVVYERLRQSTEKEGVSTTPSITQNPMIGDDVSTGMDGNAAQTLRTPRSPQQLQVTSELLDQLIANNGTVATTLLYVTWQLSQNSVALARLQDELRSKLGPEAFAWSASRTGDDTLPKAKDVDELPYLNAVIMETLRLHAPVAGSQPRITPANNQTTLGPYENIPGGVRVSAAAWSLHRNPAVFPRPDEWHPERWLSETLEGADKKERWFWAFSSGSRMCIGSNLALYLLKYVVAAIYANFRTHIVNDEGIEQEDGFISGPRGNQLTVAFEGVKFN
ncbi:cytochrome P450 [Aspergillus vadensis CBS 113365]|uniref:Cytochrome P450 family protein n=1 Tax=Aspergillus vadensis (strain CBS 113365 / IMI 142717 / IBT 24658) TaxID=1448311 RepID=A0A319C1L0_ASPVC|nr:cytochrome P450 family protein [Aspergillus vadensis CBS 113365]PYH72103.1 cytochrome P450 family protein [Aspergillus vadensis CBS 113365]